MFDGAATRVGACPSCDATIGDRSARWCGSCGAPLTAAGKAADEPTADARPGFRRRTLLLGGLAVVLVALLVVAGDRLLGGSSPGSGVPDAAIDAPDEGTLEDVQQRRPTAPSTGPRPSCGARSAGCFLWSVEATVAAGGSLAAASGDVVAYQEADGQLIGRDVRDGSVLWTAPGAISADTWSLVIVDDLIVHRDEDGLVARSMRSGELEWRNEELAWLEVQAAELHDDVLLVAGEQPVADHDTLPQGAMVGAFDLGTGELRWHRSGASTAQALGVGLVLTAEGHLEAYGPAGDLRWEVTPDLERTPEYVWAFGHVVAVDDTFGGGRQYLVEDGVPLGIQTMPMVRDDRHTLLAETEPVGDDGGNTQTGRFLLVDGDGPVWDTEEALPDASCFGTAQLLAETVSIGDCLGGTIHLDRTDGTVVSRSDPADVDTRGGRGFGRWQVGPYEVVNAGGPDEMVLWDTERDIEFAIFPPNTWPVMSGDAWSPDLGGVLLMAGDRWLTAIELPEPDVDAPAG